MNKIATTAEPEKEREDLRPTGAVESIGPENRPAAVPKDAHGWPSRLRSYFILNPLIWAYTRFWPLFP